MREAWVVGTRVFELTGIDTKASSAAGYASVCLGASTVSQGPGSNNVFYDDWIILDTTGAANNARPGKRRIRTLYPNADATPNDGVPSTGADHYAVLDEPQVSTADYLTLANTPGTTELFGMGDLPATPLAIDCLKVSAVVSTDDGGATAGRVVVNSGGTEAEGPVTNVTAGYTSITGLWETDPATAAAWSKAGVEGLNAGYRVA